MNSIKHFQLVIVGLGCFFLGTIDWRGLTHAQQPIKTEALAFPMEARLGGNLYLQTSAEYRACCLQIYKCAEMRLETVLRSADPKPLRPAIVMDLDETVFDNSAFQTFLYKNRLEYTQKLWDDYEGGFPQDVTLIPGAKSLIQKAESLGVSVIYISNRSVPYTSATIKALRENGIDATGIEKRLFLRPDKASSDKSARREEVNARYNVLFYFGDNLKDFSEAFAAPKLPPDASPADLLKLIKQRQAAADAAACHWGIDWFVLPNPVYGEWEKLLGDNPKALLHPTSMPAVK